MNVIFFCNIFFEILIQIKIHEKRNEKKYLFLIDLMILKKKKLGAKYRMLLTIERCFTYQIAPSVEDRSVDLLKKNSFFYRLFYLKNDKFNSNV